MAIAAQCPGQEPGSVKLAWDASPSTNVTYRLYAHTNSLNSTNLASALVKLNASTNLTATAKQLAAGMWFFAVTAANAQGVESVPTAPVITTVPLPPANMRTVVVQFSATVTGTNWLDAGFMRVRFGD